MTRQILSLLSNFVFLVFFSRVDLELEGLIKCLIGSSRQGKTQQVITEEDAQHQVRDRFLLIIAFVRRVKW